MAEYRKIARDPVAAANAAASSADFRLIQFHVHAVVPSKDDTTFAGVDCSVPWATGMTRAIWDVYVSDLISFDQPASPDFDGNVARAYNAALLAHPGFPYSDVCASTDDIYAKAKKAEVRPPDDATREDRSKPERWWWRWSERRLKDVSREPPLSIAIRNGDKLPRIDGANVDDVDEFGMTPLGWAAARASRAVVASLLAKGADPWFGNYCVLRTRDWSRYGPLGGNLLTTPIVIAVVHRRFDIAADMLAKVPRKRCDGSVNPVVAQQERAIVIRAVDIYARAYGAEGLRREMVRDYFDQLALSDNAAKQGAWNGMAEFAWRYSLSDILRSRPEAELRSSGTFAGHMANRTSLAELRYWIDRLDLRSPKAVRDMFAWVRPLGQTNKDRLDYEARVSLLAKLAAPFDAAQKHEILGSLLTGHGLGQKGADIQALRTFVTALRGAGFDLSATDYGRDGSDHCTLLMLALSYSYRDECSPGFANDKFAKVLLEQGVDPNVGRTSAGLAAWDIVQRRIDKGPNSNQFDEIRTRMMELRAPAAVLAD